MKDISKIIDNFKSKSPKEHERLIKKLGLCPIFNKGDHVLYTTKGITRNATIISIYEHKPFIWDYKIQIKNDFYWVPSGQLDLDITYYRNLKINKLINDK